MDLALTVRDLDPADLPELTWTGGQTHLQAITGDLGPTLAGDMVQLVVALPNGQLVGHGRLDLRPDPPTVGMLAVHPMLQSLGVGTAMITAFGQRARAEGHERLRIAVEHDNPRAAALYRRLGYREVGDEVQYWSEGHGRTYVTVCTVLERRLG